MRRVKKGVKQSVWSYMRRNRNFCTKDILAITGIDWSFLKTFIYHLEKVGYLKVQDGSKALKERCYRLVKDTGPIAPKTAKGEVYDYNLKQTILFKSKIEYQLQQLLVSLEVEEFLNDYLKDPLLLLDIKTQLRAAKKIDRLDILEDIAQRIRDDN